MAWFWLIGALALPVVNSEPNRSPGIKAVESAAQKVVDHLSYEAAQGQPTSSHMVRKIRKAVPSATSREPSSTLKALHEQVSWKRMVRRAKVDQAKPAPAANLKDAWSKAVNKYSPASQPSQSATVKAIGSGAKPRMVRKRRTALLTRKSLTDDPGIGASSMMRREGFSPAALAEVDSANGESTSTEGNPFWKRDHMEPVVRRQPGETDSWNEGPNWIRDQFKQFEPPSADGWVKNGLQGTYGHHGTMKYDKAKSTFFWPPGKHGKPKADGTWGWDTEGQGMPALPVWRKSEPPGQKWFWRNKAIYAWSGQNRRRGQYDVVSGENWQTGAHGLNDGGGDPVPEFGAAATHSAATESAEATTQYGLQYPNDPRYTDAMNSAEGNDEQTDDNMWDAVLLDKHGREKLVLGAQAPDADQEVDASDQKHLSLADAIALPLMQTPATEHDPEAMMKVEDWSSRSGVFCEEHPKECEEPEDPLKKKEAVVDPATEGMRGQAYTGM